MIAVAGGKGGSGKTTTTLGVARGLASRDATGRPAGRDAGRVVAVDADWDLPNLAALAESTEGIRSADRSATSVASSGLDPHGGADGSRVLPDPVVLSAPADPGAHDPVAVLSKLERTLGDATMLIDCPAGAAPDAAAPLRVADGCVLVTPLRTPALRDTTKTAALARALDCPVHGVVVTRATSAPDGVADLLDCPVLGTVPAAPPTPLADAAVRSAYDRVVHRLGCKREGPELRSGATTDGVPDRPSPVGSRGS